MSLHFLDTCALQHRYIDSVYSRRVRSLVSRESCQCFISEWSVLEIASALANRSRKGILSIEKFDLLNGHFLKDVASGSLGVINLSGRDFIRARDLIRFAGVVKKRNLKSGDAMVATSCLAFSLQRKEGVSFYTSDWTLYDTLRGIDAFTSRLKLVFLGTPKSP